ncbi:MAG: hypothetical protein Q9169_008636 [Polycauliona sp. 2 TL-2023]
MHLTLPTLLSLLSSTTLASPLLLQQRAAPTINPSAKGYQGPGVYTLTNAFSGLRADLYLGNTAPGTSINGWGSSGPYYNAHQYWQITDVGQGQVIIINNGTGTLFSSGTGGLPSSCTGQNYPPWRKEARWVIIDDNGGGETGLVGFGSVASPGGVMDVMNAGQPFGLGTPVQVAAKQEGSRSQLWGLQLHL